MPAETYPHIRAQIVDAKPDMLVTAWARRSSGDEAQFLLRQTKVGSMAEAIELLTRLARQEVIAPGKVDVDTPLELLLSERERPTNSSSGA